MKKIKLIQSDPVIRLRTHVIMLLGSICLIKLCNWISNQFNDRNLEYHQITKCGLVDPHRDVVSGCIIHHYNWSVHILLKSFETVIEKQRRRRRKKSRNWGRRINSLMDDNVTYVEKLVADDLYPRRGKHHCLSEDQRAIETVNFLTWPSQSSGTCVWTYQSALFNPLGFDPLRINWQRVGQGDGVRRVTSLGQARNVKASKNWDNCDFSVAIDLRSCTTCVWMEGLAKF